MGKPSARRRRKSVRKVFASAFDLRKKKHADLLRRIEDEELTKAILRHKECPLSLAEKLRRYRPVSTKELPTIERLAQEAVFQVATHDACILSAHFVERDRGRFMPAVAATDLPSAPSDDGNLFLCMYVRASFGPRGCSLGFPQIDVDGDKRTVLLSGHMCHRIAERAGIKGSTAAFIAQSIKGPNRNVFRQVRRSEPLIAIWGLNKELVGYCPIKEINCKLDPKQVTEPVLMSEQSRWMLKTFLSPEMVTLADDDVAAEQA